MATESIAPQAAGAAASTSGLIAAHPVAVALIGGALVGVGVYFLVKYLTKPKEEPSAAS